MTDGIIIKKYNSYYYVQSEDNVAECKLRGRFKQSRYSLCVGDRVTYIATEHGKGIIEQILPRKSLLLRPMVANIQQVIITFAAKNPDFNVDLMNRFLVLGEYSNLDIVICLTKIDLLDNLQVDLLINQYENIGYRVIKISNKHQIGIAELMEVLDDKVSVFAGPSGVGKSTLLNLIEPKFNLKTGDVSNKIGRGKHTTRFAELLPLSNGGFVVDTPGFSFTEFVDLDERAIADCFPEFHEVKGSCKFNTCLHLHEPQCVIKRAVIDGIIDDSRYQSYSNILSEIKKAKRGF